MRDLLQQFIDWYLAALQDGEAHAHVVGVTGAPGAGKSTLVAAIAAELAGRGREDVVGMRIGNALAGERFTGPATEPAALEQ